MRRNLVWIEGGKYAEVVSTLGSGYIEQPCFMCKCLSMDLIPSIQAKCCNHAWLLIVAWIEDTKRMEKHVDIKHGC